MVFQHELNLCASSCVWLYCYSFHILEYMCALVLIWIQQSDLKLIWERNLSNHACRPCRLETIYLSNFEQLVLSAVVLQQHRFYSYLSKVVAKKRDIYLVLFSEYCNSISFFYSGGVTSAKGSVMWLPLANQTKPDSQVTAHELTAAPEASLLMWEVNAPVKH